MTDRYADTNPVGELEVTIVLRIRVDDLAHYEATSLEEAATHLGAWYDDGTCDIGDDLQACSLQISVRALPSAKPADAAPPELHTPQEWLRTDEFVDVTVMDCDGWTDEEWSARTPISRDEFEARLAQCTVSTRR